MMQPKQPTSCPAMVEILCCSKESGCYGSDSDGITLIPACGDICSQMAQGTMIGCFGLAVVVAIWPCCHPNFGSELCPLRCGVGEKSQSGEVQVSLQTALVMLLCLLLNCLHGVTGWSCQISPALHSCWPTMLSTYVATRFGHVTSAD
jgi:hypothetical protein